jgi:hypothetical protein
MTRDSKSVNLTHFRRLSICNLFSWNTSSTAASSTLLHCIIIQPFITIGHYHGMMLRVLSSLVAAHAMKSLLPFLALVIICFLYHCSLNEAAIMATGKWCFRADATSTLGVEERGEGIQQASQTWQHTHLP